MQGYTLLYRLASGGSTTTLTFLAFSTDAITVTVKELEKGTEYIFSIIACNSAGDGATLTLDPVETDIDRELVRGRGAGGEMDEKREEGYTFVDLHYMYI